MENLSQKINVLIPVYLKGKRAKLEILEGKMEPTNKMDLFTVAVIKNQKNIGLLPLGKTGRFSKTTF